MRSPAVRLLLASALVALSAPAPSSAQELRYPAARKSDQVDLYHGVAVRDPYRWLENTNSPETRAWIEAQNALTQEYLRAVPQRTAIHDRLTELWNYPRHGVPQKEGGRYFYTENSGLQNQSVLYVQDNPRSPARVLLDPNVLSADGTVSLAWWEPSPSGRLLGYSVSDGGSDWREIHVRDVLGTRDLVDTLRHVKFSYISWTRDNRGFFYSRFEPDTGDALTRIVQHHRVFYHRLGTPQSADQLVFERPENPDWIVTTDVTHDGQYLIMNISQGTEENNRIYFVDLGNPGRPEIDNPVVRLLDQADAMYSVVGNIGPVFIVRTDHGAPRGRIVGIDINTPREQSWLSFVPEGRDAIEDASWIGERLVVRTLSDASSRLHVYEPARRLQLDPARAPPPRRGQISGPSRSPRAPAQALFRLAHEIELPAIGTVTTVSGTPDDPELFYDFTSFLHPRAIYRYDVRRATGEVFREPRLTFDPSQYETRQVFFASADGTRVPMFVTMKKGLTLDGTNPTLLYGYGGFNSSTTPSFNARNIVWLEMGGIYAVANIRGGGEYGRDWHNAGRLDNKQNVFDDFIAAAEYLISERYTSSAKLAITGGSNGGLLVGAVLNQRPALFGAALPSTGVMDMLRFHRFTIGWAWVSDYGSPDDPDQFRTLYAYSPLHNIAPATRYPPTLVLTADYDDRVIPGHSFKYTATLQEAQAGPAPVLIRVETRAGHGAGTSTTKQIDEAADRLAFLVRALDFDPAVDW
jgi:prolyl oligopeptidase